MGTLNIASVSTLCKILLLLLLTFKIINFIANTIKCGMTHNWLIIPGCSLPSYSCLRRNSSSHAVCVLPGSRFQTGSWESFSMLFLSLPFMSNSLSTFLHSCFKVSDGKRLVILNCNFRLEISRWMHVLKHIMCVYCL